LTLTTTASTNSTLPAGTVTLVDLTSAQTLSGKTIDILDTLFTLQDNGDITKQVRFDVSTVPTATSIVLVVPSASDTLVGLGAAQTLTNKTFVAPVLGAATATSVNKVAITAPATSATLTIADTKALTTADDFTTAGAFPLTLTTTASTNATLPAGTVTLVDLASAQTLSTKSLLHTGSNVISGALKESILYKTTTAVQTLNFTVDGAIDTATGDIDVTTIAVANATLANELVQVFLDIDLSNGDWAGGGNPTFPQAFVELTLFSDDGTTEVEVGRSVVSINNVNGPDYAHANIYSTFVAAAATYDFILRAKAHNAAKNVYAKNLRFIFNKYYRAPTQTITSTVF
jgi:hypothetical protein